MHNNLEKLSVIKNSVAKVHNIINPKQKENIKKKSLEFEMNGKKYILATFNRRLFAATVDMIILSLLMLPFSYIVTFFSIGKEITKIQFDGQLISSGQDFSSFMDKMYAGGILLPYISIQVTLLTVMLLYFILFWSKKGATPGKMLMKCMIIDSTTGNKITVCQSLLRILGYIITPLTLFIGVFMIDLTQKRQGLHDKIASTLVVISKVIPN
jgi:uncharacterized RDD family membrane protein YckC